MDAGICSLNRKREPVREYSRERAKKISRWLRTFRGCIVFILYWGGSLIFDVSVCVGQVIFVVSVVLCVRCVGQCNGVEEFLSGV